MNNQKTTIKSERLSMDEMAKAHKGDAKSFVKDGDIAVFAGYNILGRALGKGNVADTFDVAECDGTFPQIESVDLDGGKKRYIAVGYVNSKTSFDIYHLIALSDDEGQTWTISNIGSCKAIETKHIEVTKYGVIWVGDKDRRCGHLYGSTDNGITWIPAEDIDLRTDEEKTNGKQKKGADEEWISFFERMVAYYEQIGDRKQVAKWEEKLSRSIYIDKQKKRRNR